MTTNERVNHAISLLNELEGKLYEIERSHSAQYDSHFIAAAAGPVADSSYVAGMLAGVRYRLVFLAEIDK